MTTREVQEAAIVWPFESDKDRVMAAIAAIDGAADDDDPKAIMSAAIEMAQAYVASVSDRLDQARYDIGDIVVATRQRRHYGKAAVREIAHAAGIAPSTAHQYANVVSFYPVDKRAYFAEHGLKYTHLREAMEKTKDPAKASEALEMAIDERMSIPALRRHLNAMTGAVASASTYFDDVGYVIGRLEAGPKINGDMTQTIHIAIEATADVGNLLWLRGQYANSRAPKVQIIIREVLPDDR